MSTSPAKPFEHTVAAVTSRGGWARGVFAVPRRRTGAGFAVEVVRNFALSVAVFGAESLLSILRVEFSGSLTSGLGRFSDVSGRCFRSRGSSCLPGISDRDFCWTVLEPATLGVVYGAARYRQGGSVLGSPGEIVSDAFPYLCYSWSRYEFDPTGGTGVFTVPSEIEVFVFGCCCCWLGARQGRHELEPYPRSRARGTPTAEEIENAFPPEFWNIFLSKKTRKMLKYLKDIPGIKWQGPLNPEVQSDDKPMPPIKKFNTSVKSRCRIIRVKKNKKFVEPAQPQHKKRPIEEHIDSMEEYKQVEREPLMIHDFIFKAIEEAKKDSNKREILVEECKEKGEPFGERLAESSPPNVTMKKLSFLLATLGNKKGTLEKFITNGRNKRNDTLQLSQGE
uniref:Uncharacterized protein n=1 Tax=Ananas comosus var. bracteatus TaxID=296719 RepID=A0A6V7QMM8_ANACO|nr:unnamed protein product [Ananas comosus var. bracteatus]